MGKKLKKHLSIDGQIAKMASRGLIIEDEEYIITILAESLLHVKTILHLQCTEGKYLIKLW